MDYFRDPLAGGQAFAEYAQAEEDWYDSSEQWRYRFEACAVLRVPCPG